MPNRVILLGHSAGGHLAALVATDGRYLASVSISPALLGMVILLDGAALDTEAELTRPGARASYGAAFGSTPEMWRRVSPIRFIRKAVDLPPFSVYFAAENPLSKRRAIPFARALSKIGGKVRVRGFGGKTHGAMFRDLKNSRDPLTADILAYLKQLDENISDLEKCK
jgi:arylformamidase